MEIGGDGDSTEGLESSHEHAEGIISCDRGYEWFVMKEVRSNPVPCRLPHASRQPELTLPCYWLLCGKTSCPTRFPAVLLRAQLANSIGRAVARPDAAHL